MGLNRQCGAFQVLKAVESFFLDKGVPCKIDSSSFCINVNLNNVQDNTANEMGLSDLLKDAENHSTKVSNGSSCAALVSVFEQIPGTILVRCSPFGKDGTVSGLLSSLFIHLEEHLRKEFSGKSHGSLHKQESKKPSLDETSH
ncbi:hypothetical protein HPP92_013580 [Vanilla planifolia]|uniref:Uncharacterized protein n=1 Tax=Vanilla planifolia TaxID=51239 RepID=A0A835QX98_VANPL|nr:hypothetical protein HPP92_013580 [Vanilla planifolia]